MHQEADKTSENIYHETLN